jgi:hypothetical protein
MAARFIRFSRNTFVNGDVEIIANLTAPSDDPAKNREAVEAAIGWFRESLESRYRDDIAYGNGDHP